MYSTALSLLHRKAFEVLDIVGKYFVLTINLHCLLHWDVVHKVSDSFSIEFVGVANFPFRTVFIHGMAVFGTC